jgi:hypothetical protein
LVLDATGIGRAIMDLFCRAALPVEERVSVTIPAGQAVHRPAWQHWSCPQKDLAGAIPSARQGGRLTSVKRLPEAVTRTGALATFRRKLSASADEALDGGRERERRR